MIRAHQSFPLLEEPRAIGRSSQGYRRRFARRTPQKGYRRGLWIPRQFEEGVQRNHRGHPRFRMGLACMSFVPLLPVLFLTSRL